MTVSGENPKRIGIYIRKYIRGIRKTFLYITVKKMHSEEERVIICEKTDGTYLLLFLCKTRARSKNGELQFLPEEKRNLFQTDKEQIMNMLKENVLEYRADIKILMQTVK